LQCSTFYIKNDLCNSAFRHGLSLILPIQVCMGQSQFQSYICTFVGDNFWVVLFKWQRKFFVKYFRSKIFISNSMTSFVLFWRHFFAVWRWAHAQFTYDWAQTCLSEKRQKVEMRKKVEMKPLHLVCSNLLDKTKINFFCNLRDRRNVLLQKNFLSFTFLTVVTTNYIM
jgi:hypothetical protein